MKMQNGEGFNSTTEQTVFENTLTTSSIGKLENLTLFYKKV